ncbi:uromodulin-like [Branchiostoma lanceolatum]|uniref:uromodulin-like n=1 Tax=Branchiostoma lanceolatum TaxID=7740 RepID=UPI0034564F9A
MELPTSPNIEHDHLTNRFPWLAKELVASGEFLMSGWCNSYVTHNSQLFYDTSGFTGLDVTSGPPCTQFSMYPVNNTNTFLLVLHNRQTNNCDDSQRQDCSCDEVCQTCDTNAQSTCQCPCSCAWDYESCTNGILGVLTDVPCPHIDECTDGSHTCSPDASCTNTVGSFDCICNSGYSGNGFTCTDDNECADGSHNCSPQASCTNTVGSFKCACTPGYSGDGVTCTDIDECADGTHNCSPDATCTNTPGTFTCACNSGYSGDGVMCTDIDECTDWTHSCSPDATCTNTPGTFTCACNSGYSGDGVSCTAGSVVDCGTKPAGMYPDPHDCTKFYQCTGDPNNPLPVHKDCAPGTLFDWNLNVCTLTSHCTASATLASETPTNAPPTASLPTDAQITAKPTPEEDTTDVAPTKSPRTTLQQTADAAFGVTTDHSTLPQTTAIVTKVITESTYKPLHSETEDVTVCTNEYMELALPADQLTHVITSGLHWNPDPSCKATFNGTHYILRTGLYQCGTTVTFDTKYVIFYNNVSLMFTHDGVITRDPDVVIHSGCKYERDEAVLSEFLPIPGGLEFVDEGFGQLSIRLDLFPTQSYLAPYSTPDYPVHYHLRERMYLQLQVQGHARQLSVIALHCEATSGRNTSLQYPLIEDGCASDDTLQLYTNSDPATQRFSLEAFRFVQEVTTIHIRCEVEVCDAADTGSRCAQGCIQGNNRQRKRALEEQGSMKSRYVISRGPIILDADSQLDVTAKRTALLIGGSVVVITLAAVLLAVKVRRSKRVHPGYQQLINLDVE